MKKYSTEESKEPTSGYFCRGFKYDIEHFIIPVIRNVSFVLGIFTLLYGGIYVRECFTNLNNQVSTSKIIPDSTKKDSIPDSVFIPKPNPLENRLK